MADTRAGYALLHSRRLFTRLLRDRSGMVNTLAAPAIMLVVLRLLFGDLIAAAQGREDPDLLPMTLLMIIGAQWMNSTYPASEAIRLRRTGLADRIAVTRGGSVPLMLGEGLHSLTRALMSATVVLVVGIALGARPSGWRTWAVLLAVAVGSALLTAVLAVFLIQVAEQPESLMAVTPLMMMTMFLSAGMVRTEAFVPVVRPFVRNNPITHFVEAVMAANGPGGSPWGQLGTGMLWLALLTLVLAVLARWAHRRRWGAATAATARSPRPGAGRD